MEPLQNKKCHRRQGSGQIPILDGYPEERINQIYYCTMKPIQFPSLKARFLNHSLLFGKKVGARTLSCNEARSYLKQSLLQSSFTHWHVFLLPVIPQKKSQQLVTSHRKSITNYPTDRCDIAATSGSALIFPWVCNSDELQGEWEYLCLKMQVINTFVSECKLPSPISNLIIQENICSSFIREVRQKIAAQTTWADMELGAPSFKRFTSTWYLWYGHWKIWKLFSASPSTDISVKDNRLRIIFILKKNRPKENKITREVFACHKRYSQKGVKRGTE